MIFFVIWRQAWRCDCKMPPTGWSWLPSLWSFGTSFRVGRGPCCLCSSVCDEEICCTGYKFCPARPLYFVYRRFSKKLLLDEGIELGLSTLLIALLKASIVLAHCVIFFYTSSDSLSSWSPLELQKIVSIDPRKRVTIGQDVAGYLQ